MAQSTHTHAWNRGSVAVIGAGMAGLSCARRFADSGAAVTVFEKSRGAGGRMSTRRTDEGLRFDHGAQYFTVRDRRFEQQVKWWIELGVVSAWSGRIRVLNGRTTSTTHHDTPRYVGVPGMNAICRQLAVDLDTRFETRVAPPRYEKGRWSLSDDRNAPLGEFDWVIISAPAPQAAELLVASPQLADAARATPMNACWAVMAAFPQPLEVEFDGAFVHESGLSWIARNSSKPAREAQRETWVMHASPAWTMDHLEKESEVVRHLLLEEFWQATGARRQPPVWEMAHRWRYAVPPQPLEHRYLLDEKLRIGACGDWCDGPRVEGAYLSGLALADRLLPAS